MVKHVSRILYVLVLAVVMAPAAQAQFVDSGFYFEIAMGKAQFKDAHITDLDDTARGFFDSYDLPVQTLSSSLDDKDRSYALISGYRLNPYLAFEAGFFRLGAFQYTSAGTVSDAGTVLPASFDFSYRAKGFLIGGNATLPLGNYFELRGRAGIASTDTRVRFTAIVNGEALEDHYSETSQDFYYGAGVGVKVWDYYRIGLDLMHHDKVGKSSGNGSTDVDNILLSFTYVY